MVSSKSKVLTSKKSIVQRRTSSSAKAKKGEKAALGVSFACSKCSCTFTAKSSLHRHVALKICDIRTTKTSDAKKSKADAKITAKKSFSCRRCGFSFTTKSTLDRHSNLKVCTEKSTLVKASCGKSKGQKSKRGSLGKKNSKIALKAMEPTIKKIRKLYSAKFEGNSDSEGSIDSAALEEDICFGCGANTLLDENNSIIVCDRCTGEYHLKCVGLDLLPRRQKWICISCKEETSAFDGLTYAIDGFALPKTGKRNVLDSNIVYSPSKPLDRAWEECKEKGFMCVSKMFDYETIKKLTHGPLQRQTSSGRIAEFWPGCLAEIENRINDSCRNLVIRGGRYDLKIPDFVVDILGLNNIIEPITSRLATIMGLPRPEIRTHNLVFVPVNTQSQAWHADDNVREGKGERHHRYFTILIHLNTIDNNCGGTEIWSRQQQVGDMIRGRPGDAFVFHGSLWHRGLGNTGSTHRIFYYASFACRPDANTDNF